MLNKIDLLFSQLEDRIISLENKISLINKKLFDDEIKDVESIKKETFDFMTAVKYMEEGKKIKRKVEDKDYYLCLFGKRIFANFSNMSNADDFKCLSIEDFKSNDWEIAE